MSLLTPRRRDVVALLAAGLSRHEVALRLGIAERTVKDHVAAVAERLPGAGHPFRRVRLYARQLLDADDATVQIDGP